MPVPAARQLLVRKRQFLVFAGLCTRVSRQGEGFAFPPLMPGQALFGPVLGEVVPMGSLVTHVLG
ncbi:hypothetical protein ACIBL6_15605 [Streptomyces sp. NPDC050400]|uniref:hypothetical protein n=1 Tax=Streptomyces sp. NPDC050400 TaxID=3365610 RepID=UPI0037889A18